MGSVTSHESDSREPSRRRKLAEVFGQVLPETTSDEQRAASSDPDASERWYRQNRPPHHG